MIIHNNKNSIHIAIKQQTKNEKVFNYNCCAYIHSNAIQLQKKQ